ncbi:hypothetical protein V1520DRAFT_345915 [Lipomyces starkeyi]|uniref:F-box domain-containing protein n=1 Tax=Lipomyces starkeyi NRRL Y-11557 TaxID=675824 RepID=A0A1E3PXP9_LIPST|nr:hypothetical protein LIPSTDRAFT_114000 [Lipomyces starkeyi NRRL Y-11557]
MSILHLPLELLQDIAFHLPTQDLPSFALTCSSFNRSLDCWSLWASRVRNDYYAEGVSYARMIMTHYGYAHQRNITWRQMYIALHAAWNTTCTENTWRVEFRQNLRHRTREHAIPEYWVRICRRMRVPPGKYAVGWNFDTTEEYLGQVIFQIAMDDDSDFENTHLHADFTTDTNHSDETAAIHAHSDVEKDNVHLTEDIAVQTEHMKSTEHAQPMPEATTTTRTTSRNGVIDSVLLCETAIPRALVARVFKHTTLDHHGTEVKMGVINIPKLEVEGHEWRDITISFEMQGGWNPNMKLNAVTLSPIRQDRPVDSSTTPEIEYSSPLFVRRPAERCRKAFDSLWNADDGGVLFDTIADTLKVVVGN